MIQWPPAKGNHQKIHQVTPPGIMPDSRTALPLWAASDAVVSQADALARQLDIDRVDTPPEQGPLLRLTAERLEFCTLGDPDLPGTLWVDFDAAATRRRSHRTGSELLIRAAGIRHATAPLLVDATAGLGRDGFLLAAHGFRVRMIEANPVVAALLADGLARARRLPHLAAIAARIHLSVGDAVAWLSDPEEQPQVVYLDPMFPERSKSAKVRQDLRLLQLLDRKSLAPEPLLTAALAVGANKVVVKRPLKGPLLAGRPPSYVLRGKAVRFDVYVGPGKKTPPVQQA